MSVTRAAARSSAASAAMRGAVDARVAEHDVVVGLGEPQRLGQREGEDARDTRERERRVDDLADADRLARDADRDAARADDHVEGVVAQRGRCQGRDGSGDARRRQPVIGPSSTVCGVRPRARLSGSSGAALRTPRQVEAS